MSYLRPLLVRNVKPEEILSRSTSRAAKKIDWIVVGNQRMGITSTWYQRPLVLRRTNHTPLLGREWEHIEVVELSSAIMTTKHVHLVTEDCHWSSVATLWPDGFDFNRWPFVSMEVKLVQIIQIVSIIPAKYVHAVFVGHCWVAMSWARPLPLFTDRVYLVPLILRNRILI